MVGIESTLELSESAAEVKKPEVAEAERERQKKFLAQLRARKSAKVASAKPVKVKAKPKRGRKMTKARKGETYYCAVCGCEVLCTTSSKSPIICCDEVMSIC